MSLLKALEKGLLAAERTVVVLLLTSMILLAFLQVVLRNALSVGFLWADPLLRHAVLWIGFLGASIATRQEKHINIDLVTRYTSPRVTNLIRIATNLFPAVVTYFLAQAGWVFLQSEMLSNESLVTVGTTDFPAWWFQAIIPAGFALISFRFLLKTIEHVVHAFRGDAPVEPNLHVPTVEQP
jgi:TRAP-type C4-dicarboxylate transport system permease small subunit